MTVFFRCDSSSKIGHGHVTRCLALAEAWRGKGGEAHFVCRELNGNALQRVAAKGFRYHLLPNAEDGEDEDAARTLQLSAGADWIVIDHYELGHGWESILRQDGRKLLAIDDLAGRRHHADALLDQNFGPPNRYNGAINPDAKILLGPSFALLRSEFAPLRSDVEPRNKLSRILVSIGADDPTGLSGKIAKALDALPWPVTARFLVGPHVADREELNQTAAQRPGFEVLDPTDAIAFFMKEADLVIGAGGSASWERCCLGLPSIVYLTAENQRPVCEGLARREAALFMGPASEFHSDALVDTVTSLLNDPARLRKMSLSAYGLCDGLGASRVLKAITGPSLRLRPVQEEDMGPLWEWANDPVVRAASFLTGSISWETHASWFRARLADTSGRFYIGLADERIGQIRFDRRDDETVVSVNLNPALRHKGLGSELIRAGSIEFLEEFPEATLHAYIRADNKASIGAFLSAGYAFDGEAEIDGVNASRYRYPV